MKILLTNTFCNIGGTESFIINMAQGLRKQGHEVEAFFFNRGVMEKYLPSGLPVHFGKINDCLNIFTKGHFDLIHANNVDHQYGMTNVRKQRIVIIVTNHAVITDSEKFFLPWNSNNCHAYVCCARWLADLYSAFGVGNTQVVTNGVDTDRYHFDNIGQRDGAPIVAWVGRGTDFWQKRIDKFAAMAPILRQAGFRIWLAEPFGPYRLPSKLAIRLKQSAEFWEAVSPLRMQEFYQKVAASWGCIVSTSSFEGFPLALLEAQSCGCPVIGPNVYGVNECVNEENGGHLYSLDQCPEQIAGTIIRVLNNEKQMAWRRSACAQFVHKYHNLDQMVKGYIKLYQASLQRETF
jgi:glycosyltransferase involved in cell wall biosynthesis